MDFITVLVLGVILVLTFIFIYAKNVHGYFERAGIPGPKPQRLLGIFKQYKEKGVAQTDIELVKKYGKVVGIYHGHKPVLLVADPEIIGAICVKEFDKFKNRKANLDLGPLLRRTVALSSNNQWMFLREHISEVFKPKYLEQITDKLLQSCNKLVANVEEKISTENDFDFQPFSLSYSVDSLCNSLFGHNVNSMKDKKDKIVNMIKKGWTAANTGVKKPAVMCSVCPVLTKYFSMKGFDAIPADVQTYLTDMVATKMEERHGSEGYHDFLSFLMKRCRRQSFVVDSENNTAKISTNVSSGYRLSETEIVANCLFFFLAGYDTTASTVAFTLYNLAQHQEYQQRLLTEINNEPNKGDLSYHSIENMQYLDMVLNETLRLFPTYLRFGRGVGKETVIKNIKFTQSLEVSFSVYAVHMDKENFPEPEKFDPERFSPENAAKIKPYSYIPFGLGQRDCFGQTYAKLAIKLAIVSLLKRFKFTLSKTQQDPPSLSKEIYLRPDNGLWLCVEKR